VVRIVRVLRDRRLVLGLPAAGQVRVGQVDADLSGSSSLDLDGHADRATVHASGASQARLNRLGVGSLTINLSGASNGQVWVRDAISAELSGASTLTYKGSPKFTRRTLSGASHIEPAKAG
jgi:hypothetical protein